MPGREKEYKDYQDMYGNQLAPPVDLSAGPGNAGGAGGASRAIPKIDDEMRNRAPGLQNNFYDTSTADFKRPYGGGGGVPAS